MDRASFLSRVSGGRVLLVICSCCCGLFAACDHEPDAPGCDCYVRGGAWDPSGRVIQDVANQAYGTVESCLCPGTRGCDWQIDRTTPFRNSGKPYYQMVLGCNSVGCARFKSFILSIASEAFHQREAWCSETISYWHREAGIPYRRGYRICGWWCDWQNYNVASLRRWYVIEGVRNMAGVGGRGRWINYDDVSYENFELGVTVPVPGAYVAIRGFEYGVRSEWKDFSHSHSLMVDEMWVHEDKFGKVFRVDISLLEGNSQNKVRNDNEYLDILSLTPQGSEWIPDTSCKIYGFGIDLDARGELIYDESRLYELAYPYAIEGPQTKPVVVDDPNWDSYAANIPDIVGYAQRLADKGGPTATASSPAVTVRGIPDNNSISWRFGREVAERLTVDIDLLEAHPIPIKGVELTWAGSYVPAGYGVQYASADGRFKDAVMPNLAGAALPAMPSVSLPAAFATSEPGVSVRYVRLVFPENSFLEDAVLEGLRFSYDPGPWEDFDGPECADPIPGDMNADCRFDFLDFAIMSSYWLQCNLEPSSACPD
ncbi:MAG: hypothetical protein JSU94_07135 [Phycisphaerales bacterium]|nr:MAG: hypothetical protein JSU94_07135 [Phycisphaerales bacterium]